MLHRNETIWRLEAIRRQARQDANEFQCPMYEGALQTVEETVYMTAFNKEMLRIARKVENE